MTTLNQNTTSSVPIIIDQIYKASVEKVWVAITNEAKMKEWYFKEMESFKPEIGFETQFIVQANGVNYLHKWKVTEVIPLKKLSYEWKYPDYPGDSHVQFELFEENQQTRLRFSHFGIETFPQDNPDFSRESCSGGWNYFICKSLKEYVEKEENPDSKSGFISNYEI